MTVECLRMGGAFGGKELQAQIPGPPSRRSERGRERAVRCASVCPASSTWRSPASVTPSSRAFDAGFEDDGRLLGLKVELYSDGGWSLLDLSEPVMTRALCHVDNAYWLPNGGERPDRAYAQDVADGLPRLRRSAGHGRHRGRPRRCAPRLGIDPDVSATATSTATAT